MFSNARLPAAHRYDWWLRASTECDGCHRPFGRIYGFDDNTKHPENLRIVFVMPHDCSVERYFCWDCAASRDKMISSLDAAFSSSVAEDGQDVFALIASTVQEDRLADQAGYESLACHAGAARGKYAKVIGGRLKALEERNAGKRS